MIEVIKITHNIYDAGVPPHLSFSTKADYTPGSDYRLLNHTLRYDLRKLCMYW